MEEGEEEDEKWKGEGGVEGWRSERQVKEDGGE